MQKNNIAWSINQARQLYRLPAWSDGYFDINNEGNMVACPHHDKTNQIDLYALTCSLNQDGYTPPVLIRFTDILQHRVDSLCQSFEQAMQNYDYRSSYTPVYPIKVNQQRKVVDDIIHFGGNRIGLEAGSKPELLTIAALSQPGNIIICNGYKDQEYIRIALIAQSLGSRVFIVVEKYSELGLIIKVAREMKVSPSIGVRVRLASVADGNWQNTGGEQSKFGLHSAQVLSLLETLRAENLLDCLQLLHFHIGSQVSNIQDFQHALQEGARFYSELYRAGAPLAYVDVGGGLGVDYDGTQSRNYCSVNYSMQTYADAVVSTFDETCRQEELPRPGILTESGRAMTAHHAVLVTNVIGIERKPGLEKPEPVKAGDPQVITELGNLLQAVNHEQAVETYNNAQYYFEQAREMFVSGRLDLTARARAEELYYAICRRTRDLIKQDQTDILHELHEKLADKYFCNFSLFQSIPDSWAIDQVFPIVPLQRHTEKPVYRAVIEDLTCDSDGMVTHYVNNDGITSSLPVHNVNPGETYLIGIFLAGAYQEILGDMHNLFGDTTSVNIELGENGNYKITEIHYGDTVKDMLDYVHINNRKLEECFQQKMQQTDLQPDLQKQYLEQLVLGLDGYTYLEE